MTKPRPVIVIDDRINFDDDCSDVEVAVVTTTNDEPHGIYIDIPWHRQGIAGTRLRRRSWACAHWIERVPASELNIDQYGYCPLDLDQALAA